MALVKEHFLMKNEDPFIASHPLAGFSVQNDDRLFKGLSNFLKTYRNNDIEIIMKLLGTHHYKNLSHKI